MKTLSFKAPSLFFVVDCDFGPCTLFPAALIVSNKFQPPHALYFSYSHLRTAFSYLSAITASRMSPAARDGLAWDDSGWDTVPVWTREPDIEAIDKVCRQTLGLEDEEACEVSFFAQGAFNKLYLVQMKQRELLMRVSLPVHPRQKVRGEATTLRFLCRATDVPVPEVFAFDDSADNDIGFEWILMERMPGVPAYKRWRTMTTSQKVTLVQRIAEFQAQIFRHEFSMIGTLEPGHDSSNSNEQPGEMVSIMFFTDSHFNYDISRGPFRTSYDWLAAYLDFIGMDQIKVQKNSEDEDDQKDAEYTLKISRKLGTLLPKIFPPIQNPPDRAVLWHEDLSLSNILVDEEGCITAIIDWECVSAMPRWTATKMPKFLEGPSREQEPKRHMYSDEVIRGSEAPSDNEDIELDNEGKDELYWIHLMEYEQTQLRKLYHARMCQLQPDLDATTRENTLKYDFYHAATCCWAGFHLKKVGQWIDAIERGEFPRLMDILESGLKL